MVPRRPPHASLHKIAPHHCHTLAEDVAVVVPLLTLAEEHGVPPYVIFPDATLLEMLRSGPRTLADMAGVSGVGARKLERYGQAFLDVLQGGAKVERSAGDLRHELVSLARSGMTPTQIARQLDVHSLERWMGRQQAAIKKLLDVQQRDMDDLNVLLQEAGR